MRIIQVLKSHVQLECFAGARSFSPFYIYENPAMIV